MWGSCPTVFDPSQAPPGQHTGFMWEKLPPASPPEPNEALDGIFGRDSTLKYGFGNILGNNLHGSHYLRVPIWNIRVQFGASSA
jgi:phytoene dehydrogenase-like protein